MPASYAQVTDQDRFPTATTARSIERADVSANDFHVRGSAERLSAAARFEIGVDVNGRYGLHALDIIETYALDGTLARVTENVSVDSARRIDTGVYASVEAAVSAGAVARRRRPRRLRHDAETRAGYFGDRSTSNGAGSGFVAVTAGSFGGFSATAQVARGFRDPVLSDRYFRGPSGRGFITGNPDLEPETSLQLDLGLRYTAPRVRAATYFYNYRIDDLIERYQTDPDFFFFRNRGRARVRGFEAEAQGDLGWGFSLESRVSGRSRPRARRRRLPRRHHARDVLVSAAQEPRVAGIVLAGTHGLVCRRHASRADRTGRSWLHAPRRRCWRHIPRCSRASPLGAQPVERRLPRQPGCPGRPRPRPFGCAFGGRAARSALAGPSCGTLRHASSAPQLLAVSHRSRRYQRITASSVPRRAGELASWGTGARADASQARHRRQLHDDDGASR